jgi:phosphatidylserine/phosphatidylglycerophosphate/cardiolipin synthase-like enzyme
VREHARSFAFITAALVVLCWSLGSAAPVSAQPLAPQERLCDPTFQDCRADILTYIQQETVEIDMGFWMMTDARYSNALVSAWQRGVKIRLLMDPRCAAAHEKCGPQNDQLSAAGIPMRNRVTSGILHWKVAIFAGQGQVEFAGANYAPFELTPEIPYVNFTDEIVMFTNNPSLVQSFMRRFDDLWISTTEFANYANATGPLVRSYPLYSIDPQLNFPPDDSYRSRSLNGYAGEQQAIDVMMFRITDEQHSNAMIAAVNRNVPVRLITDETEYRNTSRLWDAYNVDKMYNAGIQVRFDGHQGIDHAKGVVLKGTGMTIFGSSNWTSPSSDSQREHNLFTTQPWAVQWVTDLFTRKWNNATGNQETKPFVPLPPDAPVYAMPANAVINVPTTGTNLAWDAGLWAHNYDIYFGITPTPPLLQANMHLGPSQFVGDYRYYALPPLQPGTTYYWKIVSKTMAFVPHEGAVWSFRTAGTAPNNVPPTVSLTSPAGGATFTAPASITLNASASDSDGSITKVDFYAGNVLLGSDSSAPYSFTWTNAPAGAYDLVAVATDSGNATASSPTVSVTVTGNSQPSLPVGWSSADVGATGTTGSASFANGTYTVNGAGADVWGTADALYYAYRPLSGDGSIVARVASIQAINAWTKAGVMIRTSVSASSAQGFMLVASSPTKGVNFQRRLAAGGTSVGTAGTQTTAPRWVKLARVGNVLSGYESADGVNWTLVASDTFTLPDSVLIGLGVSSHVAGTNATATFDNVTISAANPPPPPPNVPPTVAITAPGNGATATAPASIAIAASASDSDGTVTKVDFFANGTAIGTSTTAPFGVTMTGVPTGTYSLTAVATDDDGATTTSGAVTVTINDPAAPPSLPAGWSQTDVGTTGAIGSASFGNGTFSVTGAGADVWGAADALQYAYVPLSGDGTIIARVASIQFVNNWTKVGVMIRSSLTPSAAQAFMLVAAAPVKGVNFQRRLADGNATSVGTAGSQSTAPRWVKLVRAGNVISGYESADGVNWTLVGSDTFVMGPDVLIGLAVSSHVIGTNATATFDNVSIQ